MCCEIWKHCPTSEGLAVIGSAEGGILRCWGGIPKTVRVLGAKLGLDEEENVLTEPSPEQSLLDATVAEHAAAAMRKLPGLSSWAAATGLPSLHERLGDEVYVGPGFIGMAWLLPQVPMDVLRAYLRWQLVSGLAPLLTHDFVREAHNFELALLQYLEPDEGSKPRLSLANDSALTLTLTLTLSLSLSLSLSRTLTLALALTLTLTRRCRSTRSRASAPRSWRSSSPS